MINFEDRKKSVIFSIVYMCICLTVIAMAVFFQYRAYNRNYNATIARMCGLIQEEYPDIDGSRIARILNDEAVSDDDRVLEPGRQFLKKYGIDTASDPAMIANEKELQRAVFTDFVLVMLFGAGFILYQRMNSRYYRRQVRQTAEYLRRINQGDYTLKMDDSREGELSILKSELYKTAIMMCEAAENAKADKLLLKDSLSDISHQLKTPLTSLSINLENLEDNPDMDAETKNRILRRTKHDVGNITHMVQAILKLSRLDADVVEFTQKDTKLSDIAKKAADSVTALCDLKDISLEISADSDESAVINCDEYWQTEAITNIVKNAVEHAARRVVIGYYRYEMYNELIVENDGDSITDEDRKNIFKRFYRGENSAADSIGIGLSLAETIIRHDNGYIMVENLSDDTFISKNECSGTRFVIRYL
ncbi:sensor histidine kinase [Agathobacter sp.]